MAELDPYQVVTHLLINGALAAHDRNRERAARHLIDAAAAIIVDAHDRVGLEASAMAQHFADYLVKMVMMNTGEAG